ncbi:hypothetical protein [Streptomyces sp. JHA26]|uniref:hypothetical protein n=1 Tax=Streptomyces sp. JHA26 TaxID=1917143 RepID=UPI0011816080|nr:hypothetical protein [Streptomyces sp. JHA26]
MNVGEVLLGRKVTKTYPVREGRQLVRLESVVSFPCTRCTRTKKARVVAVRGDDLFCNGCHGRMGVPDPVESAQRSTDRPSSSAASTGTRSPDPQVDDPAQVVVEELDSGLPRSVVNTGLSVEWKFSVRAEHLLHGTCPVPPEMAARAAPQEPLDLTFLRGRRRIGVLDEQKGARLRTTGGEPHLTGVT